MRWQEVSEGVGRITKQNQTVDVGPGEITTQAAKFGNKVDKDGRPPTLSKKVKGKSTNVLFNLGLAEGYKLQLERDKEMLVLNITDTASGKRTEVRGKPGYETGNYDPSDKLHQLLDKVGKSADISQLMNGEPVGINPKHPDADRAKKATDKAYSENKLLDKPTPSIKQLSKKHNVDKEDIISQVKKGVKVELEHTSDPKIALEIALDHINELPDYYDRLETVEENFADGKKNEGAEITMWTNPEYQGADVDDKYYKKQPVKRVDVSKLTPFEPADKMDPKDNHDNMMKFVDKIKAGEKVKPIVIVPHEGKLLIVDGHHRYFAHLKAGVDKIRAVIADPKDLTWRDDVPESVEENFADIEENFLKDIGANIKDKAVKLKNALSQEGGETAEMMDIYKRAIKKQASPKEIQQANAQFKDVLKMVGLGAFNAIPLPGASLLIIAVEKLLNKKGMSVLPSAFQGTESMATENFADGKKKGKSRPGRVKKSGASCNGSVTALRKRAKNSSGEKRRMYHWCANMKSGRKKK